LAIVEHDGRPLIISADMGGALRSWCLDGSSGPLSRDNAHSRCIQALAVIEHDREPLIVSAGDDRTIVSSRVTLSTQGALQGHHNHR
jgi:hypothetical protein